jgi:hypothetical protein
LLFYEKSKNFLKMEEFAKANFKKIQKDISTLEKTFLNSKD